MVLSANPTTPRPELGGKCYFDVTGGRFAWKKFLQKTGAKLLELLERRLDNVVFRLGFAQSRVAARQMVMHGHVKVNGKRVDIPSYRVKAGDVVAVGEKFRDLLPIKEALISSERFEVPGWLEVDIEKLSGNVLALPTREQISGDINEQLIVELYSK